MKEACGGFYRAAKNEPFMRSLSDAGACISKKDAKGRKNWYTVEVSGPETAFLTIQGSNGFFGNSENQRLFW